MLSRVRPASLFIADPALGDAFGRLRTSEPISLFETSFQRTFRTSIWDTSVASGGAVSHNANIVSMVLSTTTASGSEAVLQSRKRPRYAPGKSQLVLLTGNLKAGVANLRRRLGLYDEANGLFFEQVGSDLFVVQRSSTSGVATDTKAERSTWNIDPMNGTGPSGITLDISKQQIFLIDFQWLGSGRVRFGFVIDGAIYYVHEFKNANVLTVPYSQNATLPIRAAQTNLAALGATPDSMHVTCVSVQSESGEGFSGFIRSASSNNGGRAISSAFASALPLISIRKAAAFAKFPVELINAQCFASTSDDLLVALVLNPTLTGAVWVSASTLMEVDRSATAITGGTTLGQFYLRGNSGTESTQLFENLETTVEAFLGSDIANNSDVLSLRVQSVSGAATAFGVMSWKEFQ